MKVVVIMSTYNGETYIKDQIDSILSQISVDVELFIRDDGSTDSTIEIIKEYANSQTNIHLLEGENLGSGKSFYEALEKAPKGDYYAFSDQDDYWLPEKLKMGVTALLTKNNSIPLLYSCKTKPVDSNLKPINSKKRNFPVTFGISLVENHASGCTFIFNETARIEFLKFPIENIGIHDWDMLRIVLANGGEFIQDENQYILYRQHETNVIGSTYGWKRRIKMLLKKRSWKGISIRYERALQIRDVYKNSIPCDEMKILNCLCDYKRSVKGRIKLFLSKDIVRTSASDNFVLKMMVLLGMI